jgi:enoyl-CoA hydratase
MTPGSPRAGYRAGRLIGPDTVEDYDVEPSDDLLSDVRDGVLHLTFNRPQARNALTFAMYERLAALCQAAGEDDGIRAVLLTGAGDKAFAAGTDISQFRAFSSPEDALRYEERVERAVSTVEACPKPTVAAIAGACTGGGAAIAAACDLRIAAPDARFGFPIARTLGNCLSMANYARLAALIGPARTKDLIFTARLVAADEAQAIGLVGEVVADAEALMPRAEALARAVAANAPLTLRATKEALRRLRPTFGEDEGRDLILMCYMSRDFREGLDAFLSKRPPAWTGG